MLYDPLLIGNGKYRRWWNSELYKLYKDIEIIQQMKRSGYAG